MPELPVVTGKQAIKAFKKAGFEVVRIKGSHHVLKKEGFPNVLTVPVHGSQCLKKGLLRSLLRTADISRDRFFKLLK